MKNSNDTQEFSAFKIVLEMIHAHRKTHLVYIAAKLGIADLLKDSPKSIDKIVSVTGANAEALYRIMRGLVLYGLVTQCENGCFELTQLGKCLQTDIPDSLKHLAISTGEESLPAWNALLHTVKTGEIAFNHVFGTEYFQYITNNSEARQREHQLMNQVTKQMSQAIIDAYDFSCLQNLFDVGGGYGALISSILKANPHMKGVLFDMPSVIEEAKKSLEIEGVAHRCQTIGGNFFDSIPSGGDAYILKWILHDWNDENCIRILKNCYQAINGKGKLLVVEWIMPEHINRSTSVVHADLTMMVHHEGRERSEIEYRSLLASAGFKLVQVIPTKCGRCIIEALPEDCLRPSFQ